MKLISKISMLFTSPQFIQDYRSLPLPFLFKSAYNYHQEWSIEARPQKQGTHKSYTANLKSPQWINSQLQRIQYLLGYTQTPQLNYAHLRSIINQLLILCRHATNARPYHAAINFDAPLALAAISKLLRLTFSEASNKTFESIEEQRKEGYEFIEFPAYFHICNSWNAPVDAEVLSFYLHSYMNLLFDRHFLKYITVFDVLREGEPTQTAREIINRSIEGIIQTMRALDEKIGKNQLLSPYEMAIYLKYLRTQLSSEMQGWEKERNARVLCNYIINSPKSLEESIAHCQNLTYALYFLFDLQAMRGGQVFLVYSWICERFRQVALNSQQDYFLNYLMSLASHEDKLTCLKVDIWLNLLAYEMPLEIKVFNICPEIQRIIKTVDKLSLDFWRCKYLFWIMDSFVNKYTRDPLPFIKKMFAYLPRISFRSYDLVTTPIIFLKEITEKFKDLSMILSIHESMAVWLLTIPKKTLKSQDPSDLCDMLSLADSHPSLQQIYTPYLLTLLEMSMGHFHWTELTRIYYYGLRFGVESLSDEAKWNMEYVRRYILNEYATMGLRRREIPEDSYFYRIIGITTPQKFYENYLTQ